MIWRLLFAVFIITAVINIIFYGLIGVKSFVLGFLSGTLGYLVLNAIFEARQEES